MTSYWNVTAKDVVDRFVGKEGEFPEFVAALIRATCPKLTIEYCSEPKAKDGGVDLRVLEPSPSSSGKVGERWLEGPSVWQFKSDRTPSLSTKKFNEEVHGKAPRTDKKRSKPSKSVKSATKSSKLTGEEPPRFVVARLDAGDLYRYCLAGDVTPDKLDAAGTALGTVVGTENQPKIITPADLADWVNRFPGLVERYFRTESTWHSYETWGEAARGKLRNYVPVPRWEAIQTAIAQHTDLTQPCGAGVLKGVFTVQGFSGVGKTRIVYESLKGVSSLVIESPAGSAVALIRQLKKHAETQAIVVVDECPAEIGLQLEAALEGALTRLRIVAIDNVAVSRKGQPLWLDRIPDDVLDRILQSNFTVTPEQLTRYVKLSSGFVRFAADLCEHAPSLESELDAASLTVERYLKVRFEREPFALDALQIVSLTTLLGFKGAQRSAIEELCKFCEKSPEAILGICRVISILNQNGGFIATVGNECYVTPELVAKACLGMAWQTWGEADPDRFAKRFPPSLLESFLRRVQRSASKEVRDQVAACFRRWFNRCSVGDLAQREAAVSVELLAKFDRIFYTQRAVDLLTRASPGELMAISGEYTQDGWGARRHWVSMLEHAAQFADTFHIAEVGLRRLAMSENEFAIANNATAAWKALFSLHNSSSEVSFFDRLQVIEALIDAESSGGHVLAFAALGEIVRDHGWRILLHYSDWEDRPTEWRASTIGELRACHSAYLQLLNTAHLSVNQTSRQRAVEIVVRNLREILHFGGDALETVKAIVGNGLDPAQQVTLNEALGQFVSWDADRYPNTEYIQKVREWHASQTMGSLMSRLATVLGSPWQFAVGLDGSREQQQSAHRVAIAALAAEVVQSEAALSEALPFLTSANAHGAFDLGAAIAAQDRDYRLMERLIRASICEGESTLLGRGYLSVLLDRGPEHAVRINEILDELQPTFASNVLEIAVVHSDKLGLFQRTMSAVQSGTLGLNHLRRLEVLALRGALSDDEFVRALQLAFSFDDRSTASQVVVSLAQRWSGERSKLQTDPPPDSVLAALDEGLRRALSEENTDAYGWVATVRAMSSWQFEHACELAIDALVERSHSLRRDVQPLITAFATRDDAVVRRFEQLLEDNRRGAYLGIGHYRILVSGLPELAVIAMIARLSLRGARRLARHLPRPFLDDNDNPQVPTITLELLKRFERDSQVFEEFCVGLRSGVARAGDIAGQYEHDAQIAKQFLDHANRRVREWAKREVQEAQQDADRWREDELRDAIR